jgi:hypothetical protein
MANDFKNNIYTYLRTVTDLSQIVTYGGNITEELVGAQEIAWGDYPQNLTNKIVYKKISDPQLYDFRRDFQRWRFWIQHPDKFLCSLIAEILKDNLNLYRGNFGTEQVSYIFMLDNSDPFYSKDLQSYQIIQDYRLQN